MPDLIKSKSLRKITLAPEEEIDREFQEIDALGVQLIAFPDPIYPERLKNIADPPPLISVRGQIDLFERDSIAIVGARNASAAGRRMTSMLATGLSTAGYVITSGLARGIDGVAHQTALTTGTIAVIAGGIDQIYPKEHTSLYGEICEQGLVVTEVKFGHVARAQDFPKRNRIVSGLSRGVVVVEAAERSGTLITARLALEQGREVFAVPGSPLDPRSAGTNRLIRNGAMLVRDAEDILDTLSDMQWQMREPEPPTYLLKKTTAPLEDKEEIRRQLTELLSFTPTHRDLLVREIGAPMAHVTDVLLDMVLDGVIEETSGGEFALSSVS